MWLFQGDDTLDEDVDEFEFVLAAEGGPGAKYLVMRGEGAETGAEAAWAGCWLRGGGEVEHVSDCERPLRGRGLWLRLARGIAFQR